jgi:hypothetical protein
MGAGATRHNAKSHGNLLCVQHSWTAATAAHAAGVRVLLHILLLLRARALDKHYNHLILSKHMLSSACT